MAGIFRDPQAEEKSHTEAVIADNVFHRRLSTVRNRDVMDNHPDIELLHKEREQQARKELATLYNMTPSEKPVGQETGEQPIVSRRHTQDGCLQSFEQVMFQLAKETRRANKFHRPMTVMVVAFHDLLSIASVHGTDLYECALEFAGAAIASCLEPDFDVVGLYGDDRILVVLPETHGPQATLSAENIRKVFQSTRMEFKRLSVRLKPSIGITCLPIHGRDWKELIARADLAADAVAAAGGDAFAFGPQ